MDHYRKFSEMYKRSGEEKRRQNVQEDVIK